MTDPQARPEPTAVADAPSPSAEGSAAPGDAAAARARRWRPARSHRVGALPLAQRRAVQAALVAVALLPLLGAVVVLSQGWRPSGDNALIGLRAHDVLNGELPLIGQPTTGENFGSGIETSHPGPIEFYLLAPFVLVLGPVVGLAIGAAAINAAAMVAVSWFGFRRGGIGVMALATLAMLAMTRSLGGNLLHDPVSSNVGSMMSLALLFAAWSIVAGDLRTTPAFVAIATFCLQDHLAYLGTGTPVVVATVVVGIVWIRQIERHDRDPSWLRRTVLASAIVGAVLWAPVLIDEIWGDQNINSIFQTFTGKRTPGEGTTFALGRVAEALAPVPLFARRFGPLGYLHTPALHEWIMGVAVFAAIVGLGAWFARRRDARFAAFALVFVVASIAGGYGAVKLPVGAGIQGSNLRWMWTLGAFAWVGLAWMVWEVLPGFWREVLERPAQIVGGVALVAVTVGTLGSVDLATDRDGTIAEDLETLIDRVEQELPPGTYRVTYEGGSVVVSVGPALVHDLDHRGDRVLVDLGPFTRAYADHRAYRGEDVDGTILITAEADSGYPEGTRLLARQVFEVNRQDADQNTIRVYLIDGEGAPTSEGTS